MDLFDFRGPPWKAYTENTTGNQRFDAYDLPRHFPVVHYRAPSSAPVPVVPPRGPSVPYPPFLASQAHIHARPPPAPLPEDVKQSLLYGKKSEVIPSWRVYWTFIHQFSSPPHKRYLYPTRPRQSHTTRELQYATSFFERARLQRGPIQRTRRVWMAYANWRRILGILIIIIVLVLLGAVKSRSLRRCIARFLQKLRRWLKRIIADLPCSPCTGIWSLASETEKCVEDGEDKEGEGQGTLHNIEDTSPSVSEGTTDPDENRSTPPRGYVMESEQSIRVPETRSSPGELQTLLNRANAPTTVIGSFTPTLKALPAATSLKMANIHETQTESKAKRSLCMRLPGECSVKAEEGRQEGMDRNKQMNSDVSVENNKHEKHRLRSFFEKVSYFMPLSSSEHSEAHQSEGGSADTRPQTDTTSGTPGQSRKGYQKALSASASLHEALCDLSMLIQETEPSVATEPVNTSIPFCFSVPSLMSAIHSSTELDTPRFSNDVPLGREEDLEQHGRREGLVRNSDSLPSFSSSSREGDHLLGSEKRRQSLAERFPRAFAARTGSFHGDGRQATALRWVISSRGDKQGGLQRNPIGVSSRNMSEIQPGTDKFKVHSLSVREGKHESGDTHAVRGTLSSTPSSASQSARYVSTALTPPSSSRPVSEPPASTKFSPSSSHLGMISLTFLPAHVRTHPERIFSSLMSSSSLLVRKLVRALRRIGWPLERFFPKEQGQEPRDDEVTKGHGGETGKRNRHESEQGEEGDREEDSQASLTALSGREMAAKLRESSLFQQFVRLLRLALPKEKLCSSEGFYLLVLLSTLISRTFLSIWIASVNGRVVEGIIRQDGKTFLRGLSLLVAYAVPAALVNAAIQFSEKSLGVLLRKNLTDTLVKKYLSGLTFYQMVALDARVSHPDELLANTTASFAMLVASLFSTFLKPTLDIIFLTRSILQHLGVKAPLFLGLWYLMTAGVLHWASPPIGKKTARMHELDAKYRALHSDLLQHSEEIAFYGGGKPAYLRLQRAFDTACVYRQHVFFIYHLLMGTLDMLFAKHMSVVMGYSVVALPAFREKIEAFWSRKPSEPPALMDMTDHGKVFSEDESARRRRQKQFAEEIRSRGILARIPSRADKKEDIAHAYVRNSTLLINLAKAVGRMVLAYKEVQQLGGYTQRVYEFLQVVEDLQSGVYCPRIALSDESIGTEAHTLTSTGKLVTETNSKSVEFRDVAVVTPGGHVLLQNLSFSIQTGKNVFLLGPNGCGKTSLFRILGGLWPLVEGEVRKPLASKLFYIPQRPYMPEGTLRDQVIYPMAYEDYIKKGSEENDKELETLLRLVGLGHLLERFPEKWETWRDWHDVLSGGEKQRMAFARLFFHQPVFAILDEATSAVSVDMESVLYRLCGERNITLITISHNLSLLKYHESLLRIFPSTATKPGQGPVGQQWVFEPTEGLRRLDSYSFLLNVVGGCNGSNRAGKVKEKKRGGRESPNASRTRGKGRRVLREKRVEANRAHDSSSEDGFMERQSGEIDSSEGRRGLEKDGATHRMVSDERTGTDEKEHTCLNSRPRKQRLQRSTLITTRHVLASTHVRHLSSSRRTSQLHFTSAIEPVATDIQAGVSLSPMETEGPSHTPEVGMCQCEGDEGEDWSPIGDSPRGRQREEETQEREDLQMDAGCEGDAVIVIQECVSDLEETELTRKCFVRLPRASRCVSRLLSPSPEVLLNRDTTAGYLRGSVPRWSRFGEGSEDAANVHKGNSNRSNEPEKYSRIEGDGASIVLSETSHTSFKSIEGEEKTEDPDVTKASAASGVSSLHLVAARMGDETNPSVAKANETDRAEDESCKKGTSMEERSTRVFPPFVTSSTTPPGAGDPAYIRRRHSGPAGEGRMPLSAARIGAAAAEATMMCLKQARERQKKLELEGRQLSEKSDP